MSKRVFYPSFLFFLTTIFLFAASKNAFALQGYCAGCHTMHNSQDNLPMRYDSGTTPLAQLLRGDCYGCHASGKSNSLYDFGSGSVPQVYHLGPSNIDLAGGNFAYITGAAGSGLDDAKGHNISDLTGVDGDLSAPPGGIREDFHDDGANVNTDSLSCAGTNGCHGNRYFLDPFGVPIGGYEGITGAHHDNVNGVTNMADADWEPGHGYRFLVGVWGYEDTDWQRTVGATDHNDYWAQSSPETLGCSATDCHGGGGIRPPNNTISEFCATCHGNFHTIANDDSTGVGTGTSPFVRHPSDLSLPASGEYTAYITYDETTPIGRINNVASLDGTNSTVTPGTDAVMCLSCHMAHASDYPDMLRWDYAAMTVGGGASNGCFRCHSTK